MQTAMYQNKVIHLGQLPREDYQRIYEEAKKGKLTCPVCQEKVRLKLAISDLPAFFHLSVPNAACEDQTTAPSQEQPVIHYVERNGFRIPTTRVITSTPTSAPVVQPTRMIAPSRSFQVRSPIKSQSETQYLQELSSLGYSLDAMQLEAVQKVDGPLLIVAGAGSGKTRVLTARTAYMIHEKHLDPRSIMLVTFTAKAAAEMKARLIHYPKMTPALVQSLLVGTFHSIFYRILQYHQPLQWQSSNLLKFDWQKEQLLREGGRKIHLDDKEFAYDLALQQIGFWKNSLLFPKDIKPQDRFEEQTLYLYEHYEKVKLQQELFDFDDMLLGCYQLFIDDSSILSLYQNRFQSFMIDEFQDVNKVQYQLMKMLARVNQNICVVGDDDQSIYSFRGSDPSYLLSFEKDYPQAKVITLNENYRSSHAIVDAANRVIELNKKRRVKQMVAQHELTTLPTLFYPYDEEEEATMIIQDMQEKLENGYQPNDFAILFRTNTSSRAMFERLAGSSFPFRIDMDVEPFYERYIVKSVLSFLRLSRNEDDQDAFKTALPLLFVKQSVLNDVKAASILEDTTLLEGLASLKTGHAFQERKLQKIPALLRSFRGMSPAAALERLESELSLVDVLKKRGQEGNKLERGSDDLRDLKVAARNFDTIHDFLDHVSHMNAMNKEMKKLGKKLDQAITLSTIHRSKGLEYKVVYILQTVDGSIPHDYALESSRNGDMLPLEEERRLLYVAMTRAREELYLSVPQRRRGKKTNPARFLQPLLRP